MRPILARVIMTSSLFFKAPGKIPFFDVRLDDPLIYLIGERRTSFSTMSLIF